MLNEQINSLVYRNVQNAPETFFNEEAYLLVYPDVKNAVEAGSISSGLEHYKQYGLEENRVGFFLGSNGNDEITGFGEGTKIITGVSFDTLLNGSLTTGVSEVDTLTGTEGRDIFLLGHPSLPELNPNPQQFYVGGGDADHALIKGFESFKDSIVLEGKLENYKIEKVNENIEISTDGDLVGIVEGVTSLEEYDIEVEGLNATVSGDSLDQDLNLSVTLIKNTFNIPFDVDGSFSVLM